MNTKSQFSKNARYFSLLAATMAFGSAMAHPSEAAAFWARQAPQGCFFRHATVNNANGVATNFVSNEGCNTNSSFSTTAVCPIADTNSNPKGSITSLNVHMDGNGFLSSATRCVRFWNVVGGSCGNSVTSFVNGPLTLSPLTFANWNQNNFGYLVVVLNGVNAGTQACLKGYYSAG